MYPFRQANIGQQFLGPRIEFAQDRIGTPEIKGTATGALQRHAHVLNHRQMREHRRNLEAPHQAKARHFGSLHARDVAPFIANDTTRRRQEFRQQIKASGLAGAIRADQAMDSTPTNIQVHVAYRDEAPEFLGKPYRFKDGIRHPNHAPLLMQRLIPRRLFESFLCEP